MNQPAEVDVNILMAQIRETTAASKPMPATSVAPCPQPQNGHVPAPKINAVQEVANQQSAGLLGKLLKNSEAQQQGLIQLQQNAVAQNAHILGQDRHLNELAESIKRLAEKTAPVYLGNGRLLIKTAHVLPIIVPADDLHITAALIAEGIWDRPLTKIFQHFIKNDMAFLEIGTHIGYFTTLAAALVGFRGKIHAFEANPAMFDFLETNVRLNRCAHIAKLIPLAASNQTGKTTFHIFSKNAGNSTLSELPEQLLEEWRERPTAVEAQCTTLDRFYAGESLQFDFIKIDAEGAEPLIFEGGKEFFQNRIKSETIIAMEFNPPAIQGLKRDPKVFAQTLFDLGFKLWRIVGEDDFEPVTSPGQLDAWCITELLLTRSEHLPAK